MKITCPKCRNELQVEYKIDGDDWQNYTGTFTLTGEHALPETPEGCVGLWRFDEESGNIAYDQSGNNNDGTIHGAQRVKGKYENALSFDASRNYVSISGSFSF